MHFCRIFFWFLCRSGLCIIQKKVLRGHRVAGKGLSASHRDTTEQRPAINGDKIRMIVLQQRTGVRYMKKRDAKEMNRRETAS